MVAYIKRMVVTRKKWIHEEDFKQGVALCQAIPGATAMQTAAWVGFRTRKLRGAVAAYIGFGMPAFLLMLALSVGYRYAVDMAWAVSVLTGLRVVVVALIANAAWTFAKASVKGVREGVIVLVAAGLFYIGGTPFLIVAGAGIAGALLFRDPSSQAQPSTVNVAGRRAFLAPAMVLAIAAFFVTAVFLVDRRAADLCLVMMKVDLFAFGGGFASVPLMLHEIVDLRGALLASTFMDGIALGQITPGPIVITATFIGCQMMGILGAGVATVGIFLPSLFMVVLVEPWFMRLRSLPTFQGVTRAVLLSFVGLLISVTIQFAEAAPWSIPACILAGLASAALLCKVDVLWVVLGGTIISAAVL